MVIGSGVHFFKHDFPFPTCPPIGMTSLPFEGTDFNTNSEFGVPLVQPVAALPKYFPGKQPVMELTLLSCI